MSNNGYDKDHILELIEEELKKAKAKWPNWVNDPVHASAIISEESGELTKACLDYCYDNGLINDMVKESVQIGAMVFRFLENVAMYDKIRAYKK